ncbi:MULTISPECIES: hypothetical protein [unclassified Nocardioides]|uniref:hypothetical protein n=1 Tax=unclassified Nocardioides TaxID=2615069 RepID=UPI0006FC64BF|nr:MULTISPECIES: hypothetical protein [unclassified Nocardioides]KRA37461.1 hypothetical protein ASD81_01680 [Nocardioides sp. Root614]KRA91422.1 hypothetical protein ASD84_01945 [Nocardioides sp. Root682]
MPHGPAQDLDAAERWFVDHGLPYFVDDHRAAVARGLRRGRLLAVTGVALVLGTLAGVVIGAWLSPAAGVGGGLTVAGALLACYAVATLRAWLIVTWAVRRTFRSLGLMFPLVTRALPLLLLFMTFLFINTEVWQVGASLDGGVLWVAVLLFAALAVGFLMVRLPEELDSVDDEVEGQQLIDACVGTPLEAEARSIAGRVDRVGAVHAEVSGLQKANLVLVLLVAQAVQVLLLALAVFAFFILFGVVAMEPAVLATWLQGPVHPIHGAVGDVLGTRLSLELLRVSTFLAAFSGLYFTVYAVTDELYRRQFFSAVIQELERAVSARVAYRSMRDDTAGEA